MICCPLLYFVLKQNIDYMYRPFQRKSISPLRRSSIVSSTSSCLFVLYQFWDSTFGRWVWLVADYSLIWFFWYVWQRSSISRRILSFLWTHSFLGYHFSSERLHQTTSRYIVSRLFPLVCTLIWCWVNHTLPTCAFAALLNIGTPPHICETAVRHRWSDCDVGSLERHQSKWLCNLVCG